MRSRGSWSGTTSPRSGPGGRDGRSSPRGSRRSAGRSGSGCGSRPLDPEAKGLVERTNGYFETSFLPGRTFTSVADFNAQLAEWLIRANARHHRSLGCKPIDRWATDVAAMVPLPPVAPTLGWWLSTRLPRDHYVRLDSNDYSVDPVAVGRKVEVTADLTTVTVRWAGRVVARHERCWARHQTITDPAHRATALAMATARHRRTPTADPGEVQQRDLATYDAAFGLTEVA